MLRFLSAGESHGKALIAILEGIPANLRLKAESINRELARRQTGYGRGPRMKIEKDKVKILSGLRKGLSIGSPITLLIENKDASLDRLSPITNPRPGHADLAGGLKFNQKDMRNILERSSARETATRVAIGSVCKILLGEMGISIWSHVLRIGAIEANLRGKSFSRIKSQSEASVVRCADPEAARLMREIIDQAGKDGDSLGGCCEIVAHGVVPGLGSYTQWDRRLDGRLAMNLMSIQSVKAVEIGDGLELARLRGSESHDEIFYKTASFIRPTNHAGGIEGGMSNGQPITARIWMKPISTLKIPLQSVNVRTKKKAKAQVERADVCAVPAAGVLGEAQVAWELASAVLEKFGSDSMGELKRNFKGYLGQLKKY